MSSQKGGIYEKEFWESKGIFYVDEPAPMEDIAFLRNEDAPNWIKGLKQE